MLKKLKFVGSIVALLFGAGTVLVSLASAHPAFSSDDSPSSEKQFYLDTPVLPDHTAYPLLMVVDRLELETASPTEQIYKRIEYGQRRAVYSKELLDKGNTSLALTTLTKATKYINQAARDSLEEGTSVSLRRYVRNSLNYHFKELERLMPEFSDSDRVIVDDLRQESEVLLGQLKESLQ